MCAAPSLLKSSATIGLATMASRIFGLIRDVLLAAILGTGAAAEAFLVAFRLPNLFRRLFAEGAFSAAFIPVYLGEPVSARNDFAARILTLLSLGLVILTVIAEIFMEPLIFLLAGGFAANPEKFALAVFLSRITFPYLIFMFLTALYGALLNAAHRFLAAATAPILLNLALITAALIAFFEGGVAVIYLSWGVAVAGVLQALMMVAAAARAGLMPVALRFRATAATKKFFQLILPALATGGVVQINIIVGTRIASSEAAAIAHLYYAERLYQLPLAVIGIAIGVALLPAISNAVAQGGEARAAMSRAFHAAMLLTLPASAALVVIAGPVIAALFEYGAFGASDRITTAYVLAGFALGLPAFVAARILAAGFFARQDTRTPFYYALLSMMMNVILSLILFDYWGAAGIAVATALAAWFNALALLMISRQKNWIALFGTKSFLIALATALMAAALYAAQLYYPLPASASARILYLILLVFSGLVIYFILCHILKLVAWRNLKKEFLL